MPEKKSRRTAGPGRPFAKGVSGNAAGRPRGVPNRATRDIRALAQALTLGDPQFICTLQRRLRAGTCHPSLVQTLLAYGYGKPAQRVEVGVSGASETEVDLSRLEPEELAVFRRLYDKLTGEAGSIVIDVPVTPIASTVPESTQSESIARPAPVAESDGHERETGVDLGSDSSLGEAGALPEACQSPFPSPETSPPLEEPEYH